MSTTAAICVVCFNQVAAWQTGVMTIQIAHHQRNDGGLCPGSGQVRSTAR